MTELTRSGSLANYDRGGFYCEMLGSDNAGSKHAAAIWERMGQLDHPDLQARARDAELELYSFGITFTVYSQKDAIHRILPFGVIPRVISAAEWENLERGVIQRVSALNLFLHDIYHDRKILEDGVVPKDLILGNSNYRPEMRGLEVSLGTYAHIDGTDLVRGDDGRFLVLEGNARSPSGVSYVVENRHLMQRSFLDPEVFRPESLMGVAGLMRAYRKGRVALANAVGTGVADDKAVYAYTPRIIDYYLGEEAILSNVETHICREPEGLKYTLANLEKLVVKPAGEAGGYGVTVGPRASAEEIADCRAKLEADPDNYIAQPMINLSVCPTLVEEGVAPRHVDLPPFAITGKSTWLRPGGLSRVALKAGSIIVNSSQGGGSKDTWVLEH